MDNKKLLNFLLKDLIELDELFADKKTGNFNTLEMEFLQTRITGARKLVQILSEKEEFQQQIPEESTVSRETIEEVVKVEDNVAIDKVPNATPQVVEPIELKSETPKEPETTEEIPCQEEEEIITESFQEHLQDVLADDRKEVLVKEDSVSSEVEEREEMELENEDPAESLHKRLSDVFLKEKSVNDAVDGDSGKLEHKLSNRPVASIQTAIGINDRFQYIRELFDGKPDEFAKTVAELDSKNNIKEAVNYLQQNFKWKKNEASLKFVNLVKRRFTHD